MSEYGDKLYKRFKAAESRKSLWAETYSDAQEYAAPQREIINDMQAKGDSKDGGTRVFESTAQDAVLRFASNIQSSLIPPMKRWSKLKVGPELENDDQVSAGLEAITDVMFANLHNSNFDTQVSESLIDLAFGTGAILLHKGEMSNPFRFVNVPLSQLFLEEGPHGRIQTAFRKFMVSGRNIKEEWPDANVAKELSEKISEKPDDDVCFIECTTPDMVMLPDRISGEIREQKGYKYCVIHEETKEVIVERSMRSSPWIIFRWANLPGEIYGRGPVLTALPAIKTLNEQYKILLQSASINTLGMYTVTDDGIMNTENIVLEAGALIPVSANPGSSQGATISPLSPAGNPNLAQLIIENQQNMINRMMFGDPLGDVNLPVKTATEISLRQQDLAKRIGSSFGKLQYELITPLITRMLDILEQFGLVDLGPFTVNGNQIAISHQSPLSMAQDEEEVVRHIRYAETLVGLFGPQLALVMLNPAKFTRYLGKKMAIDADVALTDKESKEITSQLTQAAQQMAQGMQDGQQPA